MNIKTPMTHNKTDAVKALANAARSLLSVTPKRDKYQPEWWTQLELALAAYEAAPAEEKEEPFVCKRCKRELVDDSPGEYCHDCANPDGPSGALKPKPAESQAAGEGQSVDWQRAIASDFARWFENEGVGSCFDECLAIVKQHAPRPNSFHRDLGITLLDAKYLDPKCHKGCQSLVWQSRVDVLEKALEGARDAFIKYEMDVEDSPPYHHRQLMERINAALAAQPSREKEGDK